jgi:hypothetical protein
VATSDEFHVGPIGLVDLDGAKEDLVAIAASSTTNALQKTREECIPIRAIGSAVPHQGNRVRLPAGQAACRRIGIVVETPSSIEDALARPGADVSVGDLVQHKRDSGTRHPRFVRNLTLSDMRVGQHRLLG